MRTAYKLLYDPLKSELAAKEPKPKAVFESTHLLRFSRERSSQSMSAVENKQAVLRCIELFNKCTLEWVDTCYSKELKWTELPKPGTPQGRQGNLQSFRESAKQLLGLFPDRKLAVLRCVAEDDCVVLEQDWQGTAAFTIGNFVAGRIAKLRVVSFFTLNDGLITGQTDYCVSLP